ncbi:MAG: hypothetical protein VXY02_02480 [Pseudomonadota bacterium]|nr:hypothetical protein [Pseudomonadota bacterium]MEC7250206.1 hypothetical protein [Pseudomonadota bacterium]MEC7412683.1 hypothetical protein [Pseudomonadota bacterium]MEC7419995.1 hypothetical protein [Pseudomonadota bacterium]MEC7554498.1 hypothetical protein [Pseudomonadota bacterium]
MHDGITYEQFGKPAVVLCTTPFAVTAQNIARVMGLPDYRFALLQHPLGSCSEQQIDTRAADAYEQARAILLDKN